MVFDSAEAAAGAYRTEGDPSGATVRCFVCGHSHRCHYAGPAGSGCVALFAPRDSLDTALTGVPLPPLVDGGSGCLCPGYEQGRLPHAILKHLDGLAEEGDCGGCGHELSEHGPPEGCWSCPCRYGHDADI